MTKKFLKEQNITLENTWVCHDLKHNVRTVDLEQLLEDYHKWKVNKISSKQVVMRSAFDAGYNNGFKDATGSSKPERKFEEWYQKHFA